MCWIDMCWFLEIVKPGTAPADVIALVVGNRMEADSPTNTFIRGLRHLLMRRSLVDTYRTL